MINMDREQAKNKVIDYLFEDINPHSVFNIETFEKYPYEEREMTPVSPLYMGNVNPSHIVNITEEANIELMKIREITNQTGEEISYFLFGEEKPNGSVWFDTVISTYRPTSSVRASFKDLTPILEKYLTDIGAGLYENESTQIVCHGHTHGKGLVSDNYSFGDLISYVQMKNIHPLTREGKVETMGMIMSPSGDYNFIMYDDSPNPDFPGMGGFYKFPNVYLKFDDSRVIPLPAYNHGDYLKKDTLDNTTTFGSL